MSVLIKGMEMPESCDNCGLCGCYVREDGTEENYRCAVTMYPIRDFDKRHEHCPLVSVPPHRRLIEEADAVETAWMILRGLGYLKEENPQLEQTVREVFATTPAIEVEDHG